MQIVCKFPTGIFGLSDDGDSDYDDNLQRIDDSYDEEDSSDDSFQVTKNHFLSCQWKRE